jgi:hypothetical protein
MSSETLVTYTCDRCGRTEACGSGRTPEGWMRAELAPLADVTLPADVTTLSGEAAPMPRTALRLDWCQDCAAIAVPTYRSRFLDHLFAQYEAGIGRHKKTDDALLDDIDTRHEAEATARESVERVLAIELALEKHRGVRR